MTQPTPSDPAGTDLFGSRAFRYAALFLIAGSAFALRLYRIDEPPMDFRGDHQMHSAILARCWYFDARSDIEPWRRDVARAARDATAFREPPVLEYLAALSYRAAGGERLWIPRVVAHVDARTAAQPSHA